MDDAAVGESGDQLLAIVLVLRARRQAGDGLGPEVLDQRAAFRVGDRVRHRLEPLGDAREGEDAVCPVEEPELAVLPWLDVIDEAGAGTLPARPPGGELPCQHPVGERLGHDLALGGLRCDAVDRRAHERDVRADPVRETAVDQRGEPGHSARHERAVVGDVVARHDRDRSDVGPSAGIQAEDQAAEHRLSGGGAGAQRVEIALHLGVGEVGVAVGVESVPAFGDGEGDHRDLRGGQVATERVDIRTVVRRHDAVDPFLGVTVGSANGERVREALGGELSGGPGAPHRERGDAPAGGIRGVVGVPGLVSAEEAPQADVHDPHGPARGIGGCGGVRLGHSLNTSRGMVPTRSREMRCAVASETRPSTTRRARNDASRRRAVS